MASEPVDAIPDEDGDVIRVSADDDGRVWLAIGDRAVCLDLEKQERFARAYVTACRQAVAVGRAAMPGQVSGSG